MTFILAVQLKDSIVVAADNRAAGLDSDQNLSFLSTSKLIAWQHGVMVGSGESQVITGAINLFTNVAQGHLTQLPKCLKLSRWIRGLAVEHPQIEASKLLCSSYSEHGAVLYTLTAEHDHQLHRLGENELLLWMFNPDLSAIMDQLKALYGSLRPYADFASQREWIRYYSNQFAAIYRRQAAHDPMMSQSFDIFFQCKEEYVYGHIPNQHESIVDFQQICR